MNIAETNSIPTHLPRTVAWKGHDYDVFLYKNPGHYELILYHQQEESEEEWEHMRIKKCVPTTNVGLDVFQDNAVAIKTYHNYEGIDRALIDAGIIYATPTHTVPYGYKRIPVYRLTTDTLSRIR